MRALILLESLVVVALALAILLRQPAAPLEAEGFDAEHMILDAVPGEDVVYRVDNGSLLEWKVDGPSIHQSAGPPRIPIRRFYYEAPGAPASGVAPLYQHKPEVHGLFPFLGVEAPTALDRTWIWRRIRQDEIQVAGRKARCWRVDCIDPALPPGSDAVVVWMDSAVPVFGILRFERNGRTYEYQSSSPAWK